MICAEGYKYHLTNPRCHERPAGEKQFRVMDLGDLRCRLFPVVWDETKQQLETIYIHIWQLEDVNDVRRLLVSVDMFQNCRGRLLAHSLTVRSSSAHPVIYDVAWALNR